MDHKKCPMQDLGDFDSDVTVKEVAEQKHECLKALIAKCHPDTVARLVVEAYKNEASCFQVIIGIKRAVSVKNRNDGDYDWCSRVAKELIDRSRREGVL